MSIKLPTDSNLKTNSYLRIYEIKYDKGKSEINPRLQEKNNIFIYPCFTVSLLGLQGS